MKKILLAIASVIVSVEINAQGIDIYNNGSLEASFSGSNYKAVLTKTPGASKPLDDTNEHLIQAWFSVSDTKKVQFTTGDLWYGDQALTVSPSTLSETTDAQKAYHFEANQQDYYAPASGTAYNEHHVSRLFWSSASDNNGTPDYLVSGHEPYAAVYATGTSGIDDFVWFSESNKSNVTVDGVNGYYVLRETEVYYLLQERKMNNNKLRYLISVQTLPTQVTGAIYSNVNGIFIFPDDYNGSYDEADMQAINEAKIVFLPAVGKRIDSTMDAGNTYGYYWTASMGSATNAVAYGYGVGYTTYQNCLKSRGFAIRLVK